MEWQNALDKFDVMADKGYFVGLFYSEIKGHVWCIRETQNITNSPARPLTLGGTQFVPLGTLNMECDVELSTFVN